MKAISLLIPLQPTQDANSDQMLSTELSNLLEQRHAGWNDLPMEILIDIAKEAIIPPELDFVIQYPVFDEICTTFGAINKSARQAFFCALNQSYIFLTVQIYGLNLWRANVSFVPLLQQRYSSRRNRSLVGASLTSNSPLSSVILRLCQVQQFHDVSNGEVVILSTHWNMTLLRSFLLAQPDSYTSLLVDSTASSRISSRNILAIIEDIGQIIRSLKSVKINSDPFLDLLPSNLIENIPTRMMRNWDTRTKTAAHNDHIRRIRKLLEYKNIQTILPITAEAASDHIRYFDNPIGIWQVDPQVIFQRNTYVTFVLKGLAMYLFQQPNTCEDQAHILLQDGLRGDQILRNCVQLSDGLEPILPLWDWCSNDKELRVLSSTIFGMMQARAEYELALARASSLLDDPIGQHVRREPGHPRGRLDADIHMRSAIYFRTALEDVAYEHGDKLRACGVWDLFHQWLPGFDKLAKEIDRAIYRKRLKSQQYILVKPMLRALELPYTLVFPDDL